MRQMFAAIQIVMEPTRWKCFLCRRAGGRRVLWSYLRCWCRSFSCGAITTIIYFFILLCCGAWFILFGENIIHIVGCIYACIYNLAKKTKVNIWVKETSVKSDVSKSNSVGQLFIFGQSFSPTWIFFFKKRIFLQIEEWTFSKNTSKLFWDFLCVHGQQNNCWTVTNNMSTVFAHFSICLNDWSTILIQEVNIFASSCYEKKAWLSWTLLLFSCMQIVSLQRGDVLIQVKLLLGALCGPYNFLMWWERKKRVKTPKYV